MLRPQLPAVPRSLAIAAPHAAGHPKITAADVHAARFRVTPHGGYDERVMDAVLDRYADELDKLASPPPDVK